MKKKPLGAALTGSLKQEQDRATQRFENLDTVLSSQQKAADVPPEAEPAAKAKPAQPPRKKSKTNTRYKPEMKRDGFVMPLDDYTLIQETIDRLLDQRIVANKTQVLRMALHALKGRTDKQLHALFTNLDPITQGRPKDE